MENVLNTYLNYTHANNAYNNSIQLRLQLDLETIISFDDPIYTFDEVLRGCNVEKYLKSDTYETRGRIGFNLVTMLKVVIFGYMINGNISTRKFMNHYLKDTIENIFKEINSYIFTIDNVDLLVRIEL